MIDILKFNESNKYVYCRLLEESNLDERLDNAKQVQQYCDRFNTNRLLVDISLLENDLNLKDSYTFLRTIRRQFRMYYFAAYCRVDFPGLRTISELSKRSGETRIRLFFSLQEAEKWLVNLQSAKH